MSLLPTCLQRSPLSTQQRAEEGECRLTVLVLAGEQDFTLPWEMKMRQGKKEKIGSNMTEAEKAILYFNPYGFFLMLH